MDEDMRGAMAPMRGDLARLRDDAGGLRDELDLLSSGAERASRLIENGLLRAVRTGKLGFEDLGKIALSVMDQIARSAIRDGVGAIFGGGGSKGLAALGSGLIAGALGLPGRATGGPVSPGRAYMVGERGPEVFLPTSSGQILPNGPSGGGRDVRVSITVNGSGQEAPRALARSARQVARAVRGALAD